jgi:hypothetical protein
MKSNLKRKTPVVCFLLFALMSCSVTQKEVPTEQWLEMEFIVDGRVDIRAIVPPAKLGTESIEPQFISTSLESTQTMLFASYDPGRGRNRDLFLTRITSTVIRIEPKSSHESEPSLEFIKNEIYLSRADAARQFEIVGEVAFNDHPWLRVNLIGGYRRGISYSTIIDGEYILIVGMSIFGENSDQNHLFQTRQKTLKKIVNSTKFSTD